MGDGDQYGEAELPATIKMPVETRERASGSRPIPGRIPGALWGYFNVVEAVDYVSMRCLEFEFPNYGINLPLYPS